MKLIKEIQLLIETNRLKEALERVAIVHFMTQSLQYLPTPNISLRVKLKKCQLLIKTEHWRDAWTLLQQLKLTIDFSDNKVQII
jgi:hypothetical protein